MVMYSNEFEAAFSDFLERHAYDEAEHYLFSMVRLALPPAGGRLGDSPPKPSEFTSSCPRRRTKLRPRRNYNRKGWAPGFPETHPLFRVFYFKALERTLKAGVPETFSRSKTAPSAVRITAPISRMRARPLL